MERIREPVTRTATLLLIAILLVAVPAVNADGMLDPSFGTVGIVITHFPGPGGGSYSYATSLVVLPDGRAVAAGSVRIGLMSTGMAAARYLTSGATDPTFSADGVTAVAFPFFNSFVTAQTVLLQPDGRIVLVGDVDSFQVGRLFALARLNVDGSPDPSFGTGGQLTTSFAGGARALAGVLQPDGRIVAVGDSGTAAPTIAAARYNADGSLDATFGTAGQLTLPLAQPFAVRDVALQPDGKIVIGGASGSGATLDFGLVRLLPNGTPDASFDGDGVVISDFGASEGGNSVILRGDGRLFLGGYRTAAAMDFAVVRYLTDGTLDTTFGTGGLATADSGATDVPDELIELPDGKLVLAGWSGDANAEDFLLARFHSDGALDTAFGTGGFIRTDVSAGNDECHGVALAGQGLVLTAGVSLAAVSPDFALARYIATTPVELLAFEVE